MAAYINIIVQGTVYFVSRRPAQDEHMMKLYSRKLVGVGKEFTFDASYSWVRTGWHQQDDTVDPFGDRRRVHVGTVWTFDLDNDVLRFDKKDQRKKIPLSLVRQRPITASDFEPYEPAPLPGCTLQSMLPSPYWNPRYSELKLQNLRRRRPFVSRVLEDFSYQWRHVLRGRYNDSTLRKVACAIVRIATLNFQIKEVASPRRGNGGYLVWIINVPDWEPFTQHIVRVGRMSIVLSQHLAHAVTLVREDFAKRSLARNSAENSDQGFIYLLLSVREIILYRISKNSEKCTEPEPFLNGIQAPSSKAIELLLAVTQRPVHATPVHGLPIELQDMVLDKVSLGPVEGARVGCMLNLGSTFSWKCSGRDIEREEGHRHRTPWTPVESQIWFGDYFSGIAYK